jgi:acid phosphatase type 7
VFTAGDNVYETGTSAEFRDCFAPTWGRHLARIRPVPGNHDWASGRLDGYFGYFGDAARGPAGASWYSFDLGTWHIVMLDSECAKNGGCGADSDQGRWLRADLATADQRCVMAIWHKPRFSSGFHGSDVSFAPFWEQLYAAGADVIVNGHDHDYERFAPQDPDGAEDRRRGIRQFVVGTGGAALRRFKTPVANSELRAIVAHGVIAFTLRDGSYDWVFTPTEGPFSDRGSAPCH